MPDDILSYVRALMDPVLPDDWLDHDMRTVDQKHRDSPALKDMETPGGVPGWYNEQFEQLKRMPRHLDIEHGRFDPEKPRNL